MARSKLRGEWFWCDRWTTSDAFTLPIAARGLYREMLTQAWVRGGSLPSDPGRIRRACGVTVEEWNELWPQIASYWATEGERIFNAVQREVMDASKRLSKTRAKAGAKGAANRQAKRVAKSKPPSPSPSQDLDPISEDSLSARAAPAPKIPDPFWIAEAWNGICVPVGMVAVRLPLSKPRTAKIRAALKATEATKDDWVVALRACSRDTHWQGRNDRGWRGNIESFLAPSHRERWLDAGAGTDGGQDGSLESLAAAESKKTGRPASEILADWRSA